MTKITFLEDLTPISRTCANVFISFLSINYLIAPFIHTYSLNVYINYQRYELKLISRILATRQLPFNLSMP